MFKKFFKTSNKLETILINYLFISLLIHFLYQKIGYIKTLPHIDLYNDQLLFTIPNIILLIFSIITSILGKAEIDIFLSINNVLFSIFKEISDTINSLPFIGKYFHYFNWNFAIILTIAIIIWAIIRKVTKTTIKLSVLMLIVYVGYVGTYNVFNNGEYKNISYLSSNLYHISEKESVTLIKVIDGDTIKVNYQGKETTVRLLYIDTPEFTKNVEPFGFEAKQTLNKVLKDSESIYLELDGEKYDKYGRLLAWVWTDKALVQEIMTKNGLVEDFYDYGDYKYEDMMINALEYAKLNNLGMYDK